MENNNENLKNSNSENPSFFEQKVSSSNGNEDFIPKLRFKEFNENLKLYKLSQIVDIFDGTHQTPNYTNRGIKFVSVEDIKNLDATNKYISEKDYIRDFKITPELYDILMTRIGDIGTPAIVNTSEKYAFYVSLALFKCHKKILLPQYFLQRIASEPFQHELWKRTLHIAFPKKINKNEIGECKTYICSKNEQQKIANFLSLIDKRIEKQRQLIESLKKYKRGLLSAIFERKIRFKDDNGNDYPEWNKIPLGSIFVERVEKATGNEELLSVTINEGIKKRNTIDIKDNSSEDKSHYKKVYKDDIAYNTMRMWQGASGVSKYNGMVSPAYTVISPKIDVNIDFWSYYLKYYKIIHLFQKFSQGLTSDTWNLKFPQFAEIKVLVPSKVEQEKLAEILLTFDNNINIYQNYLDKLEQLKKSLLQQMFI